MSRVDTGMTGFCLEPTVCSLQVGGRAHYEALQIRPQAGIAVDVVPILLIPAHRQRAPAFSGLEQRSAPVVPAACCLGKASSQAGSLHRLCYHKGAARRVEQGTRLHELFP